MARKSSTRAVAGSQLAQQVFWRYLARNPDFVADLAALKASRDSSSPHVRLPGWVQAEDLFRQKWGLLPPNDLITSMILNPSLDLDAWIRTAEWPSPVEIESEEAVIRQGEDVDVDPGLLSERPTIYIRVALTQPLDTLVALIETKLREFIHAHHDPWVVEERIRTHLESFGTTRRRLDKTSVRLDVFDRAVRGETFREIARAVGRRVSSVKSMFLVVRRDIFRVGPLPSKKALPLVGLDPAKHVSTCGICSSATTFEAMCPRAQRYALKDHRSAR
jgi:hypothetical protein